MKLTRARLATQLLDEGREPADVVDHFGAMQGQDLPGLLTSLALRTPSRSVERVQEAFTDGQIVRTWPQRGTLHAVGATRLREVLTITRERTNLDKYLSGRGVSAEQMERARDVTGMELSGGPKTRAHLVEAWRAAGLPTDKSGARHYLMVQSLTGVTAFGPLQGRQQLVVLVDDWIKPTDIPNRADVLDGIVSRYVRSHAPTTISSIKWWTGLPLRDIAPVLQRRGWQVDEAGWLWGDVEPSYVSARSLYLLPPYDEFMLGYDDRNVSIPAGRERDIHNGYGVFTGSIVYGGRTIGTWSRPGGKVVTDLFSPVTDSLHARIRTTAGKLP